MIIFLYGPDTYRSEKYLAKMIDKFKAERDPAGYNVSIFDALAAENSAKILSDIVSLPFLAEKRLVVVKNLLSSKDSDFRASIAARIKEQKVPTSTVLVLWEAIDVFKNKEAKAMFELLQAEKFKEHFPLLIGRELQTWISQEVASRGGSILPPATIFLADKLGKDMLALTSVLDQLTAYVGERTITQHDILMFVDEPDEATIFSLVDAVVEKNTKKAFHLVRETYRRGEDAGYILAMLTRQFRIMLLIADALQRNNEPPEILAKKMSLHPFVVKKTIPLIRRYTFFQLEKKYYELLEIDAQTKTGQGDQSVLLDGFIGRLCL